MQTATVPGHFMKLEPQVKSHFEFAQPPEPTLMLASAILKTGARQICPQAPQFFASVVKDVQIPEHPDWPAGQLRQDVWVVSQPLGHATTMGVTHDPATQVAWGWVP